MGLTAWDYPSGLLAERAGGVDIVHVGDSLGKVILGLHGPLSLTLDVSLPLSPSPPPLPPFLKEECGVVWCGVVWYGMVGSDGGVGEGGVVGDDTPYEGGCACG